MPAWPAPSRDDEVWALVAFLRRMPEIPAEVYKAVTRLRDSEHDVGRMIAKEGLIVGPFVCSGCHGPPAKGALSVVFRGSRGRKLPILRWPWKILQRQPARAG